MVEGYSLAPSGLLKKSDSFKWGVFVFGPGVVYDPKHLEGKGPNLFDSWEKACDYVKSATNENREFYTYIITALKL